MQASFDVNIIRQVIIIFMDNSSQLLIIGTGTINVPVKSDIRKKINPFNKKLDL
jgi:hypothetical protein